MRARTSSASALSVGRPLSALSSLSFLYLFLFFRKGLRKTLSLLSCFLFCLFSLLSLCFASLRISAVSLFLSISRKRYVISLSERDWFAREIRQPPIIRLPVSITHNTCNLSYMLTFVELTIIHNILKQLPIPAISRNIQKPLLAMIKNTLLTHRVGWNTGLPSKISQISFSELFF